MAPLELADRFERQLGDARDPSLLLSFAARVADDEAERYPAPAMDALDAIGLHHHYVPAALGGALRDFESLGALLRVVARRDLAVAVSHAVSFLGSMSTWLAGDESQRRALARDVLAGARVSLALTEPDFGSDMLNMASVATPADGGGWRLAGEKWLVNGIARNRFVTVYARTAAKGGPRGFGLFLLDKAAAPGACTPTPRIATLGVRAADIGGLAFDAALPASALIGAPGDGFEVVLKALQLSRTLCGALALGALDTAFDSTLLYAGSRIVYGKPVTELPQSRKLLCDAWGDLLVADSLSGLALRALQAVPEQASVHSSVVKYLVPTLAEQAIRALAVVHGARHYLRDAHDAGIFQKMLRDQLLIGLFDGSTQVNLFTLSHQLRSLARQHQPAPIAPWMARATPLADFSWQRLSLSGGGRDDFLAGFDAAAETLRATFARRGIAGAERGWIESPLDHVVRTKHALLDDIAALSPQATASGDPQAFELARRYCVLVAASGLLAECVQDEADLAPTLGQPAVLALALKSLATQLGDARLLPTPCYQAAFAALQARRRRDGQAGLRVAAC